MAWYYVKNGQQIGPVEDAAFAELRRNGTVGPDTLIWNATMAEWAPCSRIYPVATSQPAAAPAGGTSTCRECGRQFPSDQVVPLADGVVCAGCKPMALRKLQEGISSAGAHEYAGFWIRFAAKMIDGLIVGFVFGIMIVAVVVIIVASAHQGKPNEDLMTGLILICELFFYVAIICYDAFFIGRYGATPGKMAVGIKVVRSDDSRISYLRAFGRACANLLSGAVCYIGYIIAGFDDEKRSLHDHICDTRVVYKR